MSIFYFVPYSLEKNIGKAYNQYMSLLPNDNDWGVLMDGDTMFLTFDWGHAIAEVINKLPDAGIITCQTNRIRQKKQLYDESSPDILVHRLIAKTLDEKYRGQTRKINTHISGFFMAIKKKTWKDVGKFPEADGKLLTVDNAFSNKIIRSNKNIYLMRGMYVFHYYRFAEGKNYTDHLRNAQEYIKKNPVKAGRSMRLKEKNIRNKKSINKRRR